MYHHLLGILLRHLEIGDSVQQVDVSHLLTTTNEAVQRLHQLAWIETVLFTQIDEQLLIALAGGCQLLLTAAFFSLSAALFLLTFYLLNLWSIGIVGQEFAKLHRHDFLDKLVFVDILKIALDILHEGSNLLVIDIGLHNLVHHLVELLLADFLSRRDDALLELLANDFLDIANLEFLTTMNDTDARTFLTGTACTPRAVGVVLDIIGQTVVDDVCEVIDIQTTSSHIGSHQQLDGVLAELLHSQVALLLRQVTVQ